MRTVIFWIEDDSPPYTISSKSSYPKTQPILQISPKNFRPVSSIDTPISSKSSHSTASKSLPMKQSEFKFFILVESYNENTAENYRNYVENELVSNVKITEISFYVAGKVGKNFRPVSSIDTPACGSAAY